MSSEETQGQSKQNTSDRALLVQTLGALDESDGGHRAWNGRDARYCPAQPDATAIIEHPGGSKVSTPVVVYNISSSGAGLATKLYLHRLTPITLQLVTHDGSIVPAQGKVQWCEYYENGMHRTGVRFDTKIKPRAFVDPEVWLRESNGDADSLWSVSRKALHIEEDELEANAVAMLTKNANIKCVNESTMGRASDLVQSNSFDIVFLSDTMSDGNAVESVSHLRTIGYSGPIFVLTAGCHTKDESFEGLGVNAVLPKPVQLVSMMSALRDLFEQGEELSGTQPIFSSLTESQCSTESLKKYLELTTKCARKLDEVLKTNDLNVALKLCNSLHSSGAGYGYNELSKTAQDVIQKLNASNSVRESAVQIRSLIRLLSRLDSRAPEESEHEDRSQNNDQEQAA